MSVQAQIMIALRDGDRLFRRPRGEICWIETADGRRVDVDRREAWLAVDHELIRAADDQVATEILEYVPTEKGRRVGAWALPTTTLWDLTREWTPEHAAKLAASRAKRTTKQVLKVLTFNSGRIRGSQVMFVSGGRLVAGFASAYREPLSEAIMNLVRPHCEEFTDVDGKQSLRITEAGIAATARPRRAR
jgi:hypothetical protein